MLLILEPQKSCESWVGTQQIRVNCYRAHTCHRRYQDPTQTANCHSEAPWCQHGVLAPSTLYTSCCQRCLSALQELRLSRRMCSSRAAALTPQLPCRSTGPRWKLRVHNPGSETTATDDNQNSKHNPYATRRNNRSWLDLPFGNSHDSSRKSCDGWPHM